MHDRSMIERLQGENRYCVLGTTDQSGRPWVTPLFFARLDDDRVCWVSSPAARHSRNIGSGAAVAITIFDSTVEAGRAEAAYLEATAAPVPGEDIGEALQALNARLPAMKHLQPADLQPSGPMVVYEARAEHRYVLVRGGDATHGNTLDMSLEVWSNSLERYRTTR